MKKANFQSDYNYDSIFPTTLRALMEENKTKQDDLAEVCGVKRQSVAQWKDGNTRPDIESLKKIAEHYNVSSDYLLGMTDVRKPSLELQAISDYTGLSEKAIERLHEMTHCCEMIETSLGNLITDSDTSTHYNAISNILSSEDIFYLVGLVGDYINEQLTITRLTKEMSEKTFYVSPPKELSKWQKEHKIREHKEKSDMYLFRIQETFKEILKEIAEREKNHD